MHHNSDFINLHAECAALKQHLASNVLLPTHQDSQGDALNTIMNLLLDIPSAEARHAYINSAILCVGNSGGTKNMGMLGRILREERLFNAVFRLFRFDHFRHRENPKVPGLSIRAIYGWFPK